MNAPSKVLAAALLAASPSCFVGSAGAAPLGTSLSLQDAVSPAAQTVQWRGHGWGGGHWGGGHGWGGGPGAGLAAGALLGGADAASRPWYGYGYDYDYAPGYYSYGYD